MNILKNNGLGSGFGWPLLALLLLSLTTFGDEASKTNPEERKPSVLITGANRGLGLELVKQYIEDDYLVYGTARKPDEADELKATGAQVVQLDVTSEESITAMAQTLEGKPLDILINNAGYFGPNKIGTKQDGIDTITRSEIELCFQVNAMGPIFVTQALMPNLRAGQQKKIINMSTRSSIISRPRSGAMGYRVSKAALNMVTSTLHGELFKQGFIVVSVAPGHNKTDMGTDRAKMTPEVTMPQLKKVIDELTRKQSSGFWYYDGKNLPW
ncbi:MAG: SDR family oxidoreductase [Verrucomicrobiota bacterium JB023]|nr:SDR family oxidoreductase [Verrucomicrobiota bacterium JB023]